MGLRRYRSKRDFSRTPEPRGRTVARAGGDSYVIQRHAASRLHFDFRLELGGVLLSWAIPNGVPTKIGSRSLAVRTEDHPLEYGTFEGVIPAGHYGGGTVMLWDRGRWRADGDARQALQRGKLDFALDGERLRGRWSLVRMHDETRKGGNWLLIKRTDEHGRSGSAVGRVDRSVTTGRSMAEIAAAGDRRWTAAAGKAAPVKQEKARAADVLRPGDLPKARRASQPKTFAPQLATLCQQAPVGDDWLQEVKFDGYRLVAFLDGGQVHLRTRTGLDWTDRFPTVVEALASLPVRRAVLDGEIVVLRANGVSDFQALQNWLDGGGNARLAYFLFDLPHCEGFDLTRCALHERKLLLERVLARLGPRSPLRYSEHVRGDGPAFFAQACKLSLEGIISKRVDAPYESRRARSWVKVKCLQNQEFVVGGWTSPRGSRRHFGALLLGTWQDGELRYAGKVGTGFTDASLGEIMATLRDLEADTSPFVDPPHGADGRRAHWVRPETVVEVAFTGWTSDGKLRHPSCKGVREDKRATDVHRERPTAMPASSAGDLRTKLSNPDRVLWPAAGQVGRKGRDITKADLAAYYEQVAQHVLPHVVGRPLTIVRCPRGVAGACFYQKHVKQMLPEPVRTWRVEDKQGAGDYLGIDDLPGLLTLVQFGALELHPWGSRGRSLERPDRIVIDLDPGPDVPWPQVVAGARSLRDVLSALGLVSFARTTGGKGLHVVVPIAPRCTWDAVKAFAHDLVTAMERAEPGVFVTTASKARRQGRIFLDWLRNARGATAVASYSTRARPGATVAMPLAWRSVDARLDPGAFTVLTVPQRLVGGGDPWQGFFDVQQVLSAAQRAAVKKV